MQCLTDRIIVLVAVESIFKNPQSGLLNCYFGSLSGWITQLSNFYGHVGYSLSEHLIARGYDLFQI